MHTANLVGAALALLLAPFLAAVHAIPAGVQAPNVVPDLAPIAGLTNALPSPTSSAGIAALAPPPATAARVTPVPGVTPTPTEDSGRTYIDTPVGRLAKQDIDAGVNDATRVELTPGLAVGGVLGAGWVVLGAMVVQNKWRAERRRRRREQVDALVAAPPRRTG